MDLTVKDLKDAFGNKFRVINYLCSGKDDNYVFENIEDLTNALGVVVWCKDDILDVLEDRFGIEDPDDEDVEAIANELEEFNDILNENEDFNDALRELIVDACIKVGFDEMLQKKV